MEITEVRVKLMDDPHDRLQAFCSITFDGSFVIRDLKIIQGAKGSFVAMPSRKLTDRCPRCHSKNHLRALFCGQCGAQLNEERAIKDDEGRAKLYADIAHPINSACREMIQNRVLEEFEAELINSQKPGYICSYDDYGEDRFATLAEEPTETVAATTVAATTVAATTVAATRVISDSDDNQHRIEPAAETPGAPHHSAGTPQRKSESAAAGSGQQHNSGDGEDFGAGLL
ncbi:MAG: stage V sporulation protein G [Planctomycetaceae bacterium]|nr:stage V sporulation protein G [Planctomycetaceae bacterium]MBT6483340.1 stage V sporulation protein G [Planctomycetaceae bacterium]MBT6493865.1 stage V sporulation protein G [Planctomycetaceae bacterium]